MRSFVLIAALLAGCHTTNDDTREIVCDTLCRCAAFLPGQADECFDQCEQELSTIEAPCSDCVEREGASCSTELELCLPTCMRTDQPPDDKAPAMMKEIP